MSCRVKISVATNFDYVALLFTSLTSVCHSSLKELYFLTCLWSIKCCLEDINNSNYYLIKLGVPQATHAINGSDLLCTPIYVSKSFYVYFMLDFE